MAIFYLNEQVNEQTEEMSSEQLLDNLAEACDSMMSMLDEHGGAYNKYLKNRSDEQDKHLAKADYYDSASRWTTSEKAKKDFKEKSRKENDAAEKIGYDEKKRGYIPNSNHTYMFSSGKDKDAAQNNNPKNSDYVTKDEAKKSRDEDREAKRKWMRDHGDKGEDKYGDREPGTFTALQDKKKAIKETCLYILSILDEI